MLLNKLALQNFRNYKKRSFEFSKINIIIGPNTIGKTNVLEAIYMLSHGKSFRAQFDLDTIKTDDEFARIAGELIDDQKDKIEMTMTLLKQNGFFRKKYMVNNVAKRQSDFVSKFLTVLFTPEDIEIITDSPSARRKYFDNILLQASRNYRLASSIYEKSLRHRNRMLSNIKDGKKIYDKKEFEYWNNLLIENGSIITNERERIIEFMNQSKKDTFDFLVFYDKSTITQERIGEYFEIEQKVGITLIGPQRDEFVFRLPEKKREIKEFASRGEQRLTILQMKILEIEFLKRETGQNSILLLDDIFSELDNSNIEKILGLINFSQTIITTTHKEFIPKKIIKNVNMIDLRESMQ